MKEMENTQAISYFKKNSEKLLERAAANHKPIIITKHGKAKFVILDMETFDQLRSAESFLNVLARTDVNIDGERKIR